MEPLKHHLKTQLNATLIEIRDDSHLHQNHYQKNTADSIPSHLHITIVSSLFEEKPLIARHRMVNQILKEAFSKGLHALSLKCHSPSEFDKQGRLQNN